MPPVTPKKPKKIAVGYRAKSVEEETSGKLYLVRDKDYGDGEPVLWGRDLSWASANRLKEEIAGRRLSTTVRVEEQTTENAAYLELPIDRRSSYQPVVVNAPIGTVPSDTAAPAPMATAPVTPTTPALVYSDPGLTAARAGAMGAAAAAAADANRRHAEIKAREAAKVTPPPMPELPSDEELASMSEEDLAKLGIDPDELAVLMSGEVDDEQVAQAGKLPAGADQLPAPFNALEAAKLEPCTGCGAQPGAACVDPSGPITHPERIQAALAKQPAAPDPDPQAEAGHA